MQRLEQILNGQHHRTLLHGVVSGAMVNIASQRVCASCYLEYCATGHATMTHLHLLLELPEVVRAQRLLHGREQSSEAAREACARRGGPQHSALTLLVIEIEHQLTQLGLTHLP